MAEKLTLRFVRDVTFPARSKWYDLGLNLGLPDDTLDAIKRDLGDVDDHHRDMLKHWLKGTNPGPTGEALVAAMRSRSVGYPRLANEVETKLQELQQQTPLSQGAKLQHQGRPLSEEAKMLEPHHQMPSSEGAFSALNSKWVRAVVGVLVVLVIVSLLFYLLYWNLPPRPIQVRIPKSLPYPIHTFVGREEDMKAVIQQLDFINSDSRIISIIGPPGFGKSTLAIHIGHRMVADGVLVYYVDMREISSMQSLAEKIIDSNDTIITLDQLFTWARELDKNKTLLIFDNCDDMLQNQANYSELQNVVTKLLKKSLTLKVLITSRQRVLVELNQFTHSLHSLSTEESCELLQKITSSHNITILDSNTCVTIANLTGNAPLALQVVGALLNQPDHSEPLAIVANLENDLISTTSTGKLPVEYQVNASISLSYNHLTPSLQNIGLHLANFPGSFDEEAACEITGTKFSFPCNGTNGFLTSLVDRSLLGYSQHTKRYQFHRLIQKFFLRVQTSSDQFDSEEHFPVFYLRHYGLRLRSYFNVFIDKPAEGLLKFNAERYNFLWLFIYSELYRKIPKLLTLESRYPKWIMTTMNVFVESRTLLEFHFTRDEMSIFYQTIITYIAQNWRILYELFADYSQIIPAYVRSVTELADFRDSSFNISYALNTIASQQYVIEEMYSLHPTGHGVMDAYLLFYLHLKSYYIGLEWYENERACQEKISQKIKEYQLEPNDYMMIGLSYFQSGDYENAIHFYASFLEQNNETDAVTRVYVMCVIWEAYERLHRTHKAELIAEDLMKCFPSLMDIEFGISHFNKLTDILQVYEIIGKSNEAKHLFKKVLVSVLIIMAQERHKLPHALTSVLGSLVLAGLNYSHRELNGGNYTEAVDIAQLTVTAVSKLEFSQEGVKVPVLIDPSMDYEWADMVKLIEIAKLQCLLLIGEANYLSGNYSQGLDHFDQVVDLMQEQNVSTQLWSQLCSYAIYRGRTECIKYYVQQIVFVIFKVLLSTIAVIFKGLLDHSLVISWVEQVLLVRFIELIIFLLNVTWVFVRLYLCYQLLQFLVKLIMHCAYTLFLYLYIHVCL